MTTIWHPDMIRVHTLQLQVSLRLYTAAMQGLRKHIMRNTRSGSAWLTDVSYDPKTGKVRHGKSMQHLACFAGATIALGESD
jgi:hypothetical protein